ncbi:MAG: hypothetical protein AMXMBFR20_11020 [Planctomycetia bacterium]
MTKATLDTTNANAKQLPPWPTEKQLRSRCHMDAMGWIRLASNYHGKPGEIHPATCHRMISQATNDEVLAICFGARSIEWSPERTRMVLSQNNDEELMNAAQETINARFKVWNEYQRKEPINGYPHVWRWEFHHHHMLSLWLAVAAGLELFWRLCHETMRDVRIRDPLEP